jgi:hypothetical protein
MEGGTGEEERDPGIELEGDKVVVDLDRSGWDIELVQAKFDNLDSRLAGPIWLSVWWTWCSLPATDTGILLLLEYTKVYGIYWTTEPWWLV